MEVVKIIMSLKEILVIVAFCVVTVAYSITALLSYIRGKKAKVDPATVDEKFTEIASTVLQLVFDAEGAYSSVPKGGSLKSKDVLGDIKEMCVENGIAFDKSYWTELIKKAVNLINLNRKETDSETTTNTTTTSSGPLVG